MRKTIIAAALLCFVAVTNPGAQQGEFINNFRYNVGQSVQPVFEGWSHAADGSINMHFGYLNRNYVEQPHIPIGPNNNIEPGGPDRGQPTFFYARTRRNLFTVNVPGDWPRNRDVIWTVTVNGKTERAHGWLQAEWEIDPAGGAGGGGGSTDPERKKNQPPALTVDPVSTVKLPGPLTLSATIKDDGLPKPRGRGKPPVGQETPPTLQGGIEAPVNVPAVASRETPPGATAGGRGAERPQGPTVSWIVWRGPAEVTFSRPETQGDKRVTTATFKQPGEYVLRAVATDTMATSAPQMVKVTVQ